MPTRRIQRGPATGGPPPDFTNAPNWNELYVDGLTDEVVVGTGSSGGAARSLQKQNAPISAPYAFATLPNPAIEGMMAVVGDSTVNTWGTVIVGGGANRVLAYYNGTAWTVAAK